MIFVTEVRRRLEETLDDFEEREYLGMSLIGQCSLKLYQDLVRGRRRPNRLGRMLCHEGYLHERDILERLEKAGIEVGNFGRELVAAFDERHRGHIDGEIEGDLLEIKTVNSEGFDQVRARGAKMTHWDQVQAYMHYGGYGRAVVVYKWRETGDLWVVEVMRDGAAGERLEEKARAILKAVNEGNPPKCECGFCRGWR